MPTKNESLWLASGQAGENQARALTLPIEFTRVVVGDANGNYPPMDSSIIAVVNERLEGAVISHEVDPNDSNQRIVQMAIPPTLDFDAVELLLFAKYGNTEFAHTYFRLAAPYPIRTTENGGAQVKLKYTIRVNQNTDVNIMVSPNLAYTTEEQVNSKFKSVEVTANQSGLADKLHIFKAYADVIMPLSDDGSFLAALVDSTVDLSTGDCRLAAPDGEQMEVNGKLVSHARIVENLKRFRFERIGGVWKA
ncbi:MAG: hypothetical protein COB83_08825 [Gammaproteobacteria bacterium]|nr:MAG: hypothetical protein COB83_08825 [Gammaproteobacteria bacterium]